MGTIALMDFMGYDLNKMTLIGLTLSIGIIIDDAIVVLENIYKKMEAGMGRFEAAVEGVKEMAFAIFAISAMLLAVFIPVSHMSGIVGKFFESFAMTVGFAVIISYTVAMSFMPSLSARVLHRGESRFYNMTEPFFKAMERGYDAILKLALRFKVSTLLLVLAVFVGSLALFPKIGMDFIPKEDKAEFEVKLRAKPGISLEEMIRQAKAVRRLSQEEIIQQTRERLKPYAKKMFITAAAIPSIKGAGVSVPYQIVLTSDSFKSLEVAKEKLMAYLAKKKGFVDIDSNSYFEEKGKQYNITLRFDDAHRMSLEDIKKIQLRAADGKLVFLDGLVTFKPSTSLAAIYHFNRQRQVTIYSDLFGLDLGGAVNYTKAGIGKLLPPDVNYKFTGFADEMVKTNKAFGAALGLSVILMFIILAILYESLIQPVIIMMALPLSIIGGCWWTLPTMR